MYWCQACPPIQCLAIYCDKQNISKCSIAVFPLQGLSEYHQWMTSLLKTPT
jgi:hypothetical protein